jgi:hypothetical protein
LALFPLALEGGPLWKPLCYAQIGGLAVATFIMLLLCTDTLVEFFNDHDDMLGVDGFARLVLNAAELPLPEMRQEVLDGVTTWRHGPSPTMYPSSSQKFASFAGTKARNHLTSF